ncbi:MAG: LexA repressor [uncultured bacterium]|nr:MAG: LexA repressor [uncultured bacterium]
MKKTLTGKQHNTLEEIKTYIKNNDKSPTLNELKEILKLKTISSVQRHLGALKTKGYLIVAKNISRGLRPNSSVNPTINLPLVGTVACGTPILAEENIEAYIPYDANKLKGNSSDYFFLRAKGDSMNKAGIDDKDFVLIKKQNTAEVGQRIVALIGEEATIKKFNKASNHYILEPESTNLENKPIYVFENLLIQGIVKDVIKGGA